jgi:hypothetical protein
MFPCSNDGRDTPPLLVPLERAELMFKFEIYLRKIKYYY